MEELEGRWGGCWWWGVAKADTESEMEHVAYGEISSLMTALLQERKEM